jgi:hypothetical protein
MRAKKKIKLHDLKPKKDAKGGIKFPPGTPGHDGPSQHGPGRYGPGSHTGTHTGGH